MILKSETILKFHDVAFLNTANSYIGKEQPVILTVIVKSPTKIIIS